MRQRGWVLSMAGILLASLCAALLLAQRASPRPLVRTVALPGSPYNPVIDTRTGRLFVLSAASGSPTGQLNVLDTATGSVLRTVTLGPNPLDTLVDERTNRVFVTDVVDLTVRLLDARTGRLLRRIPVGPFPGHDVQRLALDAQTDRLVVSAGTVSLFDARRGTLLHAGIGGSSVAVDASTGRVVVADFDANRIRLLDARTGDLLYTVPVGLAPLHLAVVPRARRVFVKGETGITVVDTRRGRVVGRSAVGAARFAQMVVDASAQRVYVLDPDKGTVSTLDARSGALLGTVAVGGSPLSAAVAARQQRVFVPTQAAMRVFDARSGALLRTTPVGLNPASVAVDERRGRVFITSLGPVRAGTPVGPGTLSILDARRGTLLRTAPVGVNPGLVVVDERTGHAFIINGGGSVPTLDPWGWIPAWLRHRLPFLPPPPLARPVAGSVSMIDAGP